MITRRLARGRAVILTALPLEYMAVRSHLRDLHEEIHEGTIYERGIFLSEQWQWEVGIVQIGAGNAAAAVEAERALAYFKPDIILFVGIAGGLKDVAIGDVVASTKVYGYESGKVMRQGFQPRPDVGTSSYRLVQRAQAEARKDHWRQYIQQTETTPPTAPRVFVGPIAAGEKVLASSRSPLMAFLRHTYGDALAVEMEGRGFLHAAWRNERVQALIVRGISDRLDHKPSVDAQGFQQVAARHASAFAFAVLAQLDSGSIATSMAKETVSLVDIFIHEYNDGPVLDFMVHNSGTQTALLTRVQVEVSDVSSLYDCNEENEEEEDDHTRSFVMVSSQYDMKLAPTLKGKQVAVKIAHQLRADETDRFQLNIGQQVHDSRLAYVWYYLKITILYTGQSGSGSAQGAGGMIEVSPLLLSVPPVDPDAIDVKPSLYTPCPEQNNATIRRMSELVAIRSDSVESTIRQVAEEP